MGVTKYIVRDLVDREEIECENLETAEAIAKEVEDKLKKYAVENGYEWEYGSRVEILERVKVRDRVYDDQEDVEKMETIYQRSEEEKQELLEALNKIQKQCGITPEGANCTVLNKTIDIVIDVTKNILQKYEEGENDYKIVKGE